MGWALNTATERLDKMRAQRDDALSEIVILRDHIEVLKMQNRVYADQLRSVQLMVDVGIMKQGE